MIDRNVCHALFKVSHRIAANVHDFLYQNIGIRDCRRRVIDKPRLCVLPLVGEVVSLTICEWRDIEFLDSLLSFLQKVLGACGISFGPRHPVVFRPELRAQLFRTPVLRKQPDSHGNGHDYGRRSERNNNDRCRIHIYSLLNFFVDV